MYTQAFLSTFLASTLICAGIKAQTSTGHVYNAIYKGDNLQQLAFPIGGMGAGMFCIEGTGAISHMSVRHNPDMFNEPAMFAAISLKGVPNSAKVLEGPVPNWKKFGQRNAARGAEGTTYGLARFREASFLARFPFGEVTLHDNTLPLEVHITAWSPFIPTNEDNSSLPVGALLYRFRNTGSKAQEYVFSYNARNFMAVPQKPGVYDSVIAPNRILPIHNGFVLTQDSTAKAPFLQGSFAIFTDANETGTIVDHCWFRGGWWDPISMAWNNIEAGKTQAVPAVEKDAPGASLFVPFTLAPGQEKTIKVMMAWYVPNSRLRTGLPVKKPADSTVRDASKDLPSPYHKPWYSSRFKNVFEAADHWQQHYNELYKNTQLFRDAFYKSTLPPEVLEAVAANLTILKSPTVLRQYDGRFWGWEGCNDETGSCAGTCTHVWNYAQALPHLFPNMERSIRNTEYNESMDSLGHQNYRASLPIRPAGHQYYFPAADGQLGSIMRVYRDWRISADHEWLKELYPKLKRSIDYCITTWDPKQKGILEEPHHNTYDIEFWGPDGMCTGIYLGALSAMIRMGEFLNQDVTVYRQLLQKGRGYLETRLFNGEYFIQQVQWEGLQAPSPIKLAQNGQEGTEKYFPEAEQLLEKEGPKYQYGAGCLSDGVIGAWLANVCGLPAPFDSTKISSHLQAVYRYNLKKDLTDFSNPQRPTFAMGQEGGLLLCTWPKGDKLALPFVYSNEVWTGIEYEVASHLIMMGKVKEGLEIVRTCRNRYNGSIRNPFDEYECGHWYARALSSYALLQALTGVRYDAVEKTLYVHSRIGDFTTFLSTATGFGNVIYKDHKASLQTVYGKIPVKKVVVL